MLSCTTDQIRDVVYEIVARHLGLKREVVKPGMDAGEDAGVFFRIVADIEIKLGLSALEGDWVFDDSSVQGLVKYYRKILEERV